MKHLYFLFAFFLYFSFGNAQCTKESFALYELFTSEGCSSCPPDDKKFNSYAKGVDIGGANVLMLAHHVDYWDKLTVGPCGAIAWVDPYGSPEAREAHTEYIEAMGSNLLYTPHIFVQGKYGTNINLTKAQITGKLNSSLLEVPKSGVCIEYVSSDEIANTITFNYTLIDSENNGTEELVYFVYEDKLYDNKITAGENCNLTLDHERVRRKRMKKTILSLSDETGTLTIGYPAQSNAANLGVSAFLQDTTTRHAVGGTKGFKLNNYITTALSESASEIYTVTVYPNPANEQVKFSLGADMDYIEILDLSGKIVQSAYGIQNNTYMMNLTKEVTPGMYLFRVGSQLSSSVQKVGKLIIK